MKKKILILLIIFVFASCVILLKFVIEKFIKTETNLSKTSLVKNEVTYLNEKNKSIAIFENDYCEDRYIEKVAGHEFWCYMTPSCYDISTFKYNADSDLYTVDYIFDYDLSGNFGYTHSPYDDGYVTHLIFGTTFSPSKKQFNAQYKGFISSKIEDNKESGGYYNKLLNIYYDNNPQLVSGIEWHIKNFKNISKSTDKIYPSNYLIEVTQCIPQQLKP